MSEDRITVEKNALTQFRETVNTIIIGLSVTDQHINDAKAIKIANMPEGGDEALTTINTYYSGRAGEMHENVKAVKTALTQMMNSADAILKLYNAGGRSEEISVEEVRNVFNSVLRTAGQQPPAVTPPTVTPPKTGA